VYKRQGRGCPVCGAAGTDLATVSGAWDGGGAKAARGLVFGPAGL